MKRMWAVGFLLLFGCVKRVEVIRTVKVPDMVCEGKLEEVGFQNYLMSYEIADLKGRYSHEKAVTKKRK